MCTDGLLYLSEDDVSCLLEGIDVVEAVAAALAAHARQTVALVPEAYLGWAHDGQDVRSLSMPALVEGSVGVKVINANRANAERGLPRASGLIVLCDIATGRPTCILEAARISAVRTAAVTALASELLGVRPIQRLALLGAGALARCHCELLPQRLPDLVEIRIYDSDRARAEELAAEIDGAAVSSSAEEAIRGAQLIVPVTTTTTGYIRFDWLEPGSLLVNVSLDDALPEVFVNADKVFVDDLGLTLADERRLLGRMLRAGPVGARPVAGNASRAIDGELGQLVVGACKGRSHPAEVIVVNPFGMAIEDIAVARRVYDRALRTSRGVSLER